MQGKASQRRTEVKCKVGRGRIEYDTGKKAAVACTPGRDTSDFSRARVTALVLSAALGLA